MALPAMTSMYTPYAAAPSVFSQYAPATAAQFPTPAVSTYAPVTTVPATVTTATPATVAIAAPAAVPSFVPAPAIAPFAVPAPVSLTAGLSEPAKLEAEKNAYEQALAAQLDKQSKAVMEEAKIKKAMLEQTAKSQLEQYKLQVDETYKMACLQIDRERDQMVTGLKEAAILQQTSTEERAAVAIADYNKKKAIEDMAAKSYQLQKQWYDGEAKLVAQYQATKQAGIQKGVLT